MEEGAGTRPLADDGAISNVELMQVAGWTRSYDADSTQEAYISSLSFRKRRPLVAGKHAGLGLRLGDWRSSVIGERSSKVWI